MSYILIYYFKFICDEFNSRHFQYTKFISELNKSELLDFEWILLSLSGDKLSCNLVVLFGWVDPSKLWKALKSCFLRLLLLLKFAGVLNLLATGDSSISVSKYISESLISFGCLLSLYTWFNFTVAYYN